MTVTGASVNGCAFDRDIGLDVGTTRLSESWSPQWNQTVLTSVPARDLMAATAIEIWDDDVAEDDIICHGTLAFEQGMLQDGQALVECGSTASVVLRFQAR